MAIKKKDQDRRQRDGAGKDTEAAPNDAVTNLLDTDIPLGVRPAVVAPAAETVDTFRDSTTFSKSALPPVIDVDSFPLISELVATIHRDLQRVEGLLQPLTEYRTQDVRGAHHLAWLQLLAQIPSDVEPLGQFVIQWKQRAEITCRLQPLPPPPFLSDFVSHLSKAVQNEHDTLASGILASTTRALRIAGFSSVSGSGSRVSSGREVFALQADEEENEDI
ncbi:hypothetical protein HKX48_003406 [Thoreauomyces humboldtii]|nr:hypothetical protein HKX48_003406 [Thoreauomyces humboldtii]